MGGVTEEKVWEESRKAQRIVWGGGCFIQRVGATQVGGIGEIPEWGISRRCVCRPGSVKQRGVPEDDIYMRDEVFGSAVVTGVVYRGGAKTKRLCRWCGERIGEMGLNSRGSGWIEKRFSVRW